MNITIPAILGGQGGVGQAHQDISRAILKNGAAVGKTIQAMQDQYTYNNLAYYEDSPEGLKREEEKYYQDYWSKQNGSDPNAIENYELGLRDLQQSYADRAREEAGDQVADLMEKRAAVRSQRHIQSADQSNGKLVFDYSVKSNNLRAGQAAKDLGSAGAFASFDVIKTALEASDMEAESQRGVFGDHTDTVKRTRREAIVENGLRYSYADDKVAMPVIKAIEENPEYKNYLYQNIPAEKLDEIEKIRVARKDKMIGADAFQQTLTEADQDPGVKAGKVDRLEAAQKLWMRPETITKHGMTDLQWRNGMLNFEALLKYRDEEDEKRVGSSTIILAKKYNQHRLTYDDIDNTFIAVANPGLRAKFVEHWVKLLDTQAAQARQAAAFERTADAARTAKDPFNVDVPAVKARLLQKSIEAPFTPGLANEVALALGNGISSSTFSAISKNIQSADIWKTPAGKEVYRAINNDRKDYMFSTNEDENESRYGELIEHYRNYLEKYPDAKPKDILDDYIAKKKEMRKGWLRKQIDNHWGK